MPEWPDHFCAACGKPRKPFPRYPWHLCNDCCETAVDSQGRKLNFFNTHPSGGFGFAVAGTDEQYSCGGVIAYIAKRRVYITEARFGGIVAQPILDSDQLHKYHRVADLTRTSDLSKIENLTVWKG